MTLGMKRGTVYLTEHQASWEENAGQTIALLRKILGTAAVDIQHVGSTAVQAIMAKPIIDIAVAVKALEEIRAFDEVLAKNGIIYRHEDVADQLLYVMGDFAKDTRTHHIHVVAADSVAWRNYLAFRDYLNDNQEKALEYQQLKRHLAEKYPHDRIAYTEEKQAWINAALEEARKDYRQQP